MPFLVGGLICQANSDKRTRPPPAKWFSIVFYRNPLRGTLYIKCREAGGNNRLCDALRCPGLHARDTDSFNKWLNR